MDKNEKMEGLKEAILLVDDRIEMLEKQCTNLETLLNRNASKGIDTNQLQSLRQEVVSDIRLSLLKNYSTVESKKTLFLKQLKWLSSLAVIVVLLTSISQWFFIHFYSPPVQVTQATVVGKLLFKAMAKMEPIQKTKLMTALAKEMTGYEKIKP